MAALLVAGTVGAVGDSTAGVLTHPQTPDESVDVAPTWSPDGARMIMARQQGESISLWLADADGNDPRPLFGTSAVRVP